MYYKRFLILVGMAIFICSTITAQDFKYVGATKCKMCHNKADKGEQFKKWSEGPHANAMKSLSEAEAKDPRCLKCHSTAGSVDAAFIESITVEEGVSCESCHGPGSEYRKIMIEKDKAQNAAKGLILTDENLCKKCHNEESPHFKGFNFDEYFAIIAHEDPSKTDQ